MDPSAKTRPSPAHRESVFRRGLCFARALLLLACLMPAFGAADREHGRITGQVRNLWDGSPLSGVVVVVRGTTLAVKSAANGLFLINGVEPGEYSVTFSAPDFARATVTEVRVGPDQTSTVDISLRPEFYEMEEYEVIAEDLFAQEEELVLERQNSAAFLESIGSERFSQLAVGDAAEILTKITGVTAVEGKFAVVRGLSDRYTTATLNGAKIPSADPEKQAAQLDLFPASIIDNVTISKTFTPDQPGDSTGGLIDVRTKSLPEAFFAKLSAGLSFNSQSSLIEDFASYHGGSTDWLGIDDGTRALPSGSLINGTRLPLAPSPAAPGDTPEDDARRQQEAEAYNQAISSFLSSADYAPRDTQTFLNHDFEFSIGDTFEVGSGRLGLLGGLSYKRSFDYYDDGRVGRYDIDSTVIPFPPPPRVEQSLRQTVDLVDRRGQESVVWSSLANVAYELNDDHRVACVFMYNQNTEDEARRLRGLNEDAQPPPHIFDTSQLRWIERSVSALQLFGGHRIPAASDMELDWLVSISSTGQDEPNVRQFVFVTDPSQPEDSPTRHRFPPTGVEPQQPVRYFRKNQEDNLNARIDDKIPFSVWDDQDSYVKLGAYHSATERTFEQVAYRQGSRDPQAPPLTGDPNDYLVPRGMRTETTSFGTNYYFPRTIGNWETVDALSEGDLTVEAAYLMLDVEVIRKLRLIGGARFETTRLENTSSQALIGGFDSQIRQDDLLPSAGLSYSFLRDFKLRLNYAETVARPTFREISAIRLTDINGLNPVQGNPDLEMSSIKNYDVRVEFFPAPNEVVSIGAFYKDIQRPIEVVLLGVGGAYTWENRDEATVYGFELEARKGLGFIAEPFSNFTIGANFAWIVSEVAYTQQEIEQKLTFAREDGVRPLFDQSPYVINADLTYNNPDLGLTATVAFNEFGQRLSAVSFFGPDIYQQPISTLDVIVSMALNRNLTLKFTAKNLLNPKIKEVLDPEVTDGEYVWSQYTRGMEFGVGLSYSF